MERMDPKNILHRCSGKEINRKRHKNNNYKESQQWPMRAEEEGWEGGDNPNSP